MLEKDADALLTFFEFPAEHWKHLRTSNVIESPFATVRLRQRVTKGAGSRTKGLLMAYKLLDMAQGRWRRLDGAHLLPLVREGVVFVDGVQQASKRGEHQVAASHHRRSARGALGTPSMLQGYYSEGRHGAMPLKPDPRRQWFWFGPTSSSRRDRNSSRIGEVFDLL
jgi:hypothetical protein